jgi:hypothetical protein
MGKWWSSSRVDLAAKDSSLNHRLIWSKALVMALTPRVYGSSYLVEVYTV